jgi:hypothetical protein
VVAEECIDIVNESNPFNPVLPFNCGYTLVIESEFVPVDWDDEFADGAPVAAESHLDGAVARKNLSLSRWASRSCSMGFKGRDRPPERPGVELV